MRRTGIGGLVARGLGLMAALGAGVALLGGPVPASAADAPGKLVARKLKGRSGKLLHQALYAKDGRLGFLHDVNDDGHDDFVYLVQTGGNNLSFG